MPRESMTALMGNLSEARGTSARSAADPLAPE